MTHQETARAMFRVGMRVRLTQAGIDAGLTPQRKPYTGARVVGFGRLPHLVRIRMDGYAEDATFAMKFLEPGNV